MLSKPCRTEFSRRVTQGLLAVLCMFSVAPGDTVVYAMSALQDGLAQSASILSGDQLDSLVAPIALYPDPLLSQVLVASTYPLEIIQLQQWLGRHKDLKGDALVTAVENEDWDPSIQAMSVLPDVVDRLAENIKWTTDLGNAFLAQQSDVMDAVQRMRAKAYDAGNLKSSEQMKVESKVVETKNVIIIQQTNPQIVYVPSYNPVVVYGPPLSLYPYPAIYYPPRAYYPAGVFIGFGMGVAIGSYYRGGWGYNCGWGRHTTININVNNRYVSHYNRTNINVNRNVNNTWQHNPRHRGAAPYSNKATATKYGGSARGDSVSTRQANARQQQGSNNRAQPGTANRGATNPNRASAAAGTRPGTSAASAPGRTPSNAGARPNNAARPNPNNTAANRNNSGANNAGTRQPSGTDGSRNTSAFGGASSKANAQANSARGAASMGTSRGGGTARPQATASKRS